MQVTILDSTIKISLSEVDVERVTFPELALFYLFIHLFLFCQAGSWNSSGKAVMFENIHPNIYDGDKFKGSSLEGKSLRVVVSEVIYKHNVLCKMFL